MPAPANHAGRTREDRKFLTAPVTKDEKRRAVDKARRLKISVSDLVRLAVEAYEP